MTSSSPSPMPEDNRSFDFRSLLTGTGAIALSLGLGDLLTSLLSGSTLSHIPAVVSPMALVTGVSFVLILACWTLLGTWAPRVLGLRPLGSFLAGCAFLATVVLWYELSIARPQYRLSILKLAFIVSLSVTLSSYFITRRARNREGGATRSQYLGLAMSIVISIALFGLWTRTNDIEDRWGLEFLKKATIAAEWCGIGLAGGAVGVCIYKAQTHRAFVELGKRGSAFALATPLAIAAGLFALWFQRSRPETFGSFGGVAVIAGLCALVLVAFLLFLTFGARRVGSIFFPACVLLVTAVSLTPAVKNKIAELRGASTNKKPHKVRQIVLLTIDTLRADHVSSYDRTKGVTKHIDSLARDGILFRRSSSTAPWTLPAFVGIMTGLSPTVHQVDRANLKLGSTARTLAEILKEDGYETAAIGENIVLFPDRGLNQGFESYNFYPKPWHTGRGLGVRWINRLWPNFFRTEANGELIAKLGMKWIRENREKDFFLWLHLFDPHSPYYGHPELMSDEEAARDLGGQLPDHRERLKSLYREEVRYTDIWAGKFLDSMRELGIYDDALIVFTVDHGEELWDHGGFEHGHSLYQELIHVPLIIKPPGAKAGSVREELVSTGSVFATVLDLAGISYDPAEISHPSLAPLQTDERADILPGPVFFSGVDEGPKQEGVAFGESKYTRSEEGDWERLFNLPADPKEVNSILKSSPEDAARARNYLLHHLGESLELRALHGMEETVETDLDAATMERLKKLGYLGGN